MFCSKCGAENTDKASFCIKCGERLDNPQTQSENGSANPPPDWMFNAQPRLNPDAVTVLSIVSYISVFWLLGLLIPPYNNDSRVRFHVGQGMLLFILSAAGNIVLGILKAVIGIFDGIWILFSPLMAAVRISQLMFGLCLLGLFVYGVVNAAKGLEKPLPVIGSLAFFK